MVTAISYFWWMDQMREMVRRPLEAPKMIENGATLPLSDPGRFWGTYRSGVYFGLKTRSPRSPVVGLMWMTQFTGTTIGNHFQQKCFTSATCRLNLSPVSVPDEAPVAQIRVPFSLRQVKCLPQSDTGANRTMDSKCTAGLPTTDATLVYRKLLTNTTPYQRTS